MLVSYNWLKEYIEGDLPSVEKVAEVLNEKAFEIESVEKRGDDYILDIDILPNRAHDCLSHTGIAKEIALNLDFKFNYPNSEIKESDFETSFDVKIEDDRCKRYSCREFKNIQVSNSPDELKSKIESIGEKSINNIVDITNIVMFELGQPMHAFDKDKLEDKTIFVRKSNSGEKITTLDKNEVELDDETCLIADAGPLAIAGIKGGNKAEVDSNTTNIILESANFDAVETRKTSNKIGIRTESSKRFENEITPELVEVAMNRATELLIKYGGENIEVSNIVDIYPKKIEQAYVEFSTEQTQKLLGVEITKEEIAEILNKLGFEFEEEFKVRIPFIRLDLKLPADMIEEVGRVYGYDKIKPKPIEGLTSVQNSNQEAAGILKIKSELQKLGFSEVQTYSFVKRGDLKAVKALASDKQYLRTSLEKGMAESLDFNHYNADLIGIDTVKIFEIGKVYPKGKETLVLGLAVKNKNFKKPKTDEIIKETLEKLSKELNISIETDLKQNQEFIQIELKDLIEKIDTSSEIEIDFNQESQFEDLSSYPFVTRDISVWIPNEKGNDQLVYEIAEKHAGNLIKNKKTFDVFEKDGRTSYGVRIVLQSMEKTLNDEEVGEIMNKIYKDLEAEGLEIR